MPPVAISPRKATAETKVVHALKMGLPLSDSPSPSPPETNEVEAVSPSVATPKPVGLTAEPVKEPAPEQEPPIQVVEKRDPVPPPVPVPDQQTELTPVSMRPASESPMPLGVKGKERTTKVGNLVAHFEDANRRRPARPPRMVEQTPISALVSTIRKGFEDMMPLPALDIVEEGDSVDMTPPSRPISGRRGDGIKGLNIRSKSGLGERTALTQLNS